MVDFVLHIMVEICLSKVLGDVSAPCYYLPAARSGILQGHKALAASIVEKAPYVGIEKFDIPKFSGVVAGFLSSVISLPERKGPLYRVAQELERELIKGEVVLATTSEYVSPEIKYRFLKSEIPLHRSSSTVSELAPLILYLKHRVEPGSVLIIEEPEAHLHPENQRILAKYLVRLLRKGLSIIITTHSEYLIEQLSSFILLSKIDPTERAKKYNYNQQDFLKAEEIAVYVFGYDAETDGHKIKEVSITEEEGISQDEFLKIHEALYEEALKIQSELNMQ